MKQWKRWTQEEDDILIHALEDNSYNKKQAFGEAAKLLPTRDWKSCQNRWYQSLGNPESKHYVGCMFLMLNRSQSFENRSILMPNAKVIPKKTKKGLWAKIKKLLGLK